ncbi:MAG: helix-turn-helix domain-containing protein [Candidatus Thiodiazotropha sp. (ex Dulcina madagascariensis)]|nr:helix-turn-helix domain-containing protein [Candidatus Thiodiazotropha sp. (ex Dulcina madagascariensis)]
MSRATRNYLKTFRKHAGLTQRDVAYLAGLKNESSVCRIERSSRLPNSEAVLAILVIFRCPIDSVYTGHVQEVERMVISRAKKLYRTIDPRHATPLELHKRTMLKAISEGRVPAEQTALWTNIKTGEN